MKQPRNDITAPLRDWAARRRLPHRIALSAALSIAIAMKMALSHCRNLIRARERVAYTVEQCGTAAWCADTSAIAKRNGRRKYISKTIGQWLPINPAGEFSQTASGGLRESRHKNSRPFAARH